MNARISGLIGVVAVFAGVAACHKDPTQVGVGAATHLIANFSSLVMNLGQSASITAQIVDNDLTAVPGPITFTACDGSVATITRDTSYHPVPNVGARATVSGVGLQKVCVIASSPGLKPDTVTVTVLPTQFPGTFSKTTLGANDTVVVKGTSLFSFNPALFNITYPTVPDGIALPVLVSTTDSAVFLGVKFNPTGSWSIAGVHVNYAGIDVSLPILPAPSLHGGALAGDALASTAPDISGFLTGLPLDSNKVALLVAPQANSPSAACDETGVGPCIYLKFTVAAPITLRFQTDWDGADGGNPDVDIYACQGTATTVTFSTCFEEGGAGAGSKKPESTGFFTYPAGTHYFVVEFFAACDEASCAISGSVVNNFKISVTRR